MEAFQLNGTRQTLSFYIKSRDISNADGIFGFRCCTDLLQTSDFQERVKRPTLECPLSLFWRCLYCGNGPAADYLLLRIMPLRGDCIDAPSAFRYQQLSRALLFRHTTALACLSKSKNHFAYVTVQVSCNTLKACQHPPSPIGSLPSFVYAFINIY